MKNTSSIILSLIFLFMITAGCSPIIQNKAENSENTNVASTSASAPEEKPAAETKRSDASKGEVPANDEAQQMAKETLLAFNDAVQKGDFFSFYDSIAETWKKEIDPKTFEEAFSEFIEKKVDISAIAAKKAEFSTEPKIAKEQGFDMLTLAGEYDISPKTQFELKYIPEGKQWRLSRIRVMIGKQ